MIDNPKWAGKPEYERRDSKEGHLGRRKREDFDGKGN
jgi:hypothetical protein